MRRLTDDQCPFAMPGEHDSGKTAGLAQVPGPRNDIIDEMIRDHVILPGWSRCPTRRDAAFVDPQAGHARDGEPRSNGVLPSRSVGPDPG